MLKQITSLIFPIKCAVCGRVLPAGDRYRLCPSCFNRIKITGKFQCRGCGRVLADVNSYCFDCLKKRPVLQIRSYAQFNGDIQPLIHKFKYGRQQHLSRILARLLFIAYQSDDCFLKVDVVVPVPCHWTRRFSRGYDHVQLLAREFSVASGILLNDAVLFKKKHTPPQAKLSRERRLKNLTDAFGLRDPLLVNGKTILLLDDVCTTGATMSACAKVLLDSGADRVVGLAVARD